MAQVTFTQIANGMFLQPSSYRLGLPKRSCNISTSVNGGTHSVVVMANRSNLRC